MYIIYTCLRKVVTFFVIKFTILSFRFLFHRNDTFADRTGPSNSFELSISFSLIKNIDYIITVRLLYTIPKYYYAEISSQLLKHKLMVRPVVRYFPPSSEQINSVILIDTHLNLPLSISLKLYATLRQHA